ncbi:MAG: hypothetical protein COB99_03085, partial [Sulfurimonas sp.]
MNFRVRLYTTILISFILLSYSLYLNSRSVNATSNMIDYIETKQIKLSNMTFKFNSDVVLHQSNILQSIIIEDIHSINNIHSSVDSLHKSLETLENFVNRNNIRIDGINKTITTLKN